MRKATKLLTLVLAALMIMSVVSINASAAFTDVSVEDSALYDAVELLSTLGVAKGTTETTFGPDELVTRQQMAAFVFRLMKAGKSIEGGVNETAFADLDDSTFYYMISWASQNGIIKGRNATTFDPKGNIILQDAYVMLVRALGYEKDSTLPYPFGYIDQAEALGLDENLPSTVSYGDKLTRGNVAVLLANAFYADMNEKETKYEWVYDDSDVDKENGAYVPVEKVATVASKIFGVVEETFMVTTTAHYALDATITYDETDDIDKVIGQRYNEAGEAIGDAAFEFEMADLGLEGSSDDYFLSELTLFVKKDAKKDINKDVVIAAKSNLVKKTVKASDVTIARSTKSAKEFFLGENKKALQDMTGSIDFGGIKAYLDNEALPSSYKKLAKVGTKPAVEFIDLTAVDAEAKTYEYDTLTAAKYDFDGDFDKDGADTLDDAFKAAFPQVYAGGLYEADIYDVNGDGYAEYVHVKPYRLITIADQKNVKYFKMAPGVEATGANLEKDDYIVVGKYTSETPVIAYVAPNYIDIKEDATKVESYVTSKVDVTVNAVSGVKYTLKSGDVVNTVDASLKYSYLEGTLADYLAQLEPGNGNITVYIKDGIVLYADGVAGTSKFNANANYAIVFPNDKADNKEATPDSVVFVAEGVVNGKWTEEFFVNVLVDGTMQAVKLADYATTYVKYDKNGDRSITTSTNSTKIVDQDRADDVMATDFVNQFSTFTVSDAGEYTFAVTGIDTDMDVLEDEEEEEAVFVADSEVTVERYTSNVVTLTGITGLNRVKLLDTTKLILATLGDDGKPAYTVYNKDILKTYEAFDLANVIAVVVNNPKGDVETLGILYGEVVDGDGDLARLESTASEDVRIVLGYQTDWSEEKGEVALYKLLDIKTGTVTEGVASVTGTAIDGLVAGDYAVLAEDGKVAEEFTIGDEYIENELFEATFGNYDESTGFLTITADGITSDMSFVLADDVTIFYYNDTDTYEMTDDSVLVTVNNPIEALEEGFKIYLVAEEDKDDEVLQNVSTIVVTPAK